jgi:hypothetical protein
MKNYVDSARTLEILKQDSGLLPKPKENWNTFEPKDGDLALANNKEYIFKDNNWVEVEEESNEI